MSPLLLRISGGLLLALGAALAAVTYASDSPAGPDGKGERLVGFKMPENVLAHDFTLRDQHARRFTLSKDTAGRVVAMTFIHSKCTSTCPVSLQTIRGALAELEPAARRQIDVLAISVDPEADTPRRVKRFLATQHADDFVRYLTGTREQLRPVWRKYGIKPQGDRQEDHSAFVLLRDRDGILRIGNPSHQLTAEDLEHDLRVLVEES